MAETAGGQIVWKLDVDDTKFSSGLEKATKEAQSAGKSINKIDFRGVASNASSAFGSIAATIRNTAGLVTGFGLGLSTVFIKSAADLQKTSKSFEVLTGNADVARKLFVDIKKFADTTPFEFPELAKGAQTILGFGRNAKQTFDDIKVLGDIAAATGADFQSLAVVFGQVNATGKLMGQDALQLINNNIPITTLLAKDLGISVQEVKARMEDGAIGADVFNKALKNATSDGGFAFKGLEVLSTTLNGRLSTLKDTVLEFGRNLIGVKVDPELGLVVQPGGIFDRFTQLVPVLTQRITELTPKIQEGFGWIVANKDIIIASLIGIGAAFTTATISGAGLALLALGPIQIAAGLVTVAAGLLAASLVPVIQNMGGVSAAAEAVRARIVGLWTAFTTQLAPAISFIRSQLSDVFTLVQTNLVPALQRLWTVISPELIPAIKTLASFVGGVLFIGFANVLGQLQGFIRAISLIIEFVTTLMGKFIELNKTLRSLGESFQANVFDRLSKMGGALGGFFGGLKSFLPGFASGVTNFRGGLAVVGERGPELVNLPRGSDVISNKDISSIAGTAGSSTVTVNLHGNFMGDKTAIRDLAETLSQEFNRMNRAQGVV